MVECATCEFECSVFEPELDVRKPQTPSKTRHLSIVMDRTLFCVCFVAIFKSENCAVFSGLLSFAQHELEQSCTRVSLAHMLTCFSITALSHDLSFNIPFHA